MTVSKISISIPQDIRATLRSRRKPGLSLSGMIADDLHICWQMLDHGMEQVQHILSVDEATAVIDALKDVSLDRRTLRKLVHGAILAEMVADGCREPGFEKAHSVNGKTLVRKVRGLPVLERFALLDWVKTMQPFQDDLVRESWSKKKALAAGKGSPS